MLYGLFDIKIKAHTPGSAVEVTFHLPAPAPKGYGWFKHSNATGWYDFSDHAVFNPARDQVVVTKVKAEI